MMKRIPIQVEGLRGLESQTLTVQCLVNAGYTGRRQESVRAHIRELEHQGVLPPPEVPMFYRLPTNTLTQEAEIEVTGLRTSGEVEFVLLSAGGRLLVAVGSDHTDRECERNEILWSKQLGPNVCSTRAWEWTEVEGHWDRLILRSWTRASDDAMEILYQEGACEGVLPPAELLARASERLGLRGQEGLALYSGTVPMKSTEMVFGGLFRCELEDPVLGRKLCCEYRVRVLAQVGTGGNL